MRTKRTNQRGLEFTASNLKITNKYYARYEAVSTVLGEVPKLLDLFHEDLKKTLKSVNRNSRGRRPQYTSDSVLRILICQVLARPSRNYFHKQGDHRTRTVRPGIAHHLAAAHRPHILVPPPQEGEPRHYSAPCIRV